MGLQEQGLLAAPLMVLDPAEASKDVQEVVVLFHDFTFRDPAEILSELKTGGHDMAAMPKPPAASGHDWHDMRGMATGAAMDHGAIGHGTKSQGSMDHGGMQMGGMSHLQDVQHDALLAERSGSHFCGFPRRRKPLELPVTGSLYKAQFT